MKLDHSLSTTYTVLEPNSYLVVTADEALMLDYCVRVCELNQIPGLLALHLQSINGENRLYYDVTGKRLLSSLVNAKKLGKAQGEHVFRSLISCFTQLPEYFLRSGMCLLDLNFLFVDDHFNTYLPLLPLSTAPEQSGEELREFFLALLGQCFVDDRSEPYFDRILKYLIKPGFTLEGLEELAIPKAPSIPRSPVPPVAPPAASAPPQPQPQSKAAPTPPPAPAPKPSGGSGPVKIPGMDFAIPGGASTPAPEKKKKEKPPKSGSPAGEEKHSGGFLGGLFGGKKQAPAAPPAPPKLNMGGGTILSGASPVPPPPVSLPLGEEEWEGTVSLEGDDERTVFMDTPISFGPTLLHQNRRIELSKLPFSIGKTECSLNLKNPKVSRLHATIFQEGGTYFIRDEGSTNHTYVDGVILPPYTPYQLAQHATILLANEELRFEAGGGQ